MSIGALFSWIVVAALLAGAVAMLWSWWQIRRRIKSLEEQKRLHAFDAMLKRNEVVRHGRRYDLDDLLAQCDPSQKISDEDRRWTR